MNRLLTMMKAFVCPPTLGALLWSMTLTFTLMMLGLFLLNRAAGLSPPSSVQVRANNAVIHLVVR